MGDRVRLGLMSPLTGLVALYGREISRAGRIACDEVNERGGVLGRTLELVIEDDGSLPESAVPAARRLVDEHGCVAIIGNLLSNSRISVATRVAEPHRIPYLNFSFYEGSIYSRYFFHFAALPNQQIDRMIPYMVRNLGPKMFFAGNNYEWPRGSIDAAKRALLKVGGEVVGEEYFPIGTNEFDELLTDVANSGADVFVPYGAGNDQLELLTQFTRRGLKSRMAVVMGHYDEAMVSLLAPEVREGFYSSNTYFMTLETAENREYLRRLGQLPGVNGIWPQGNGVLTNFGEGTYLCVHAFAKAANLAGTLEAEALVDALEKITVTGPQGKVMMDPVTHHAHVNTYLSRCNRDGSFEIVERFGRNPPLIPERYRSQFPLKANHERKGGVAGTEMSMIAVANYNASDLTCWNSLAVTERNADTSDMMNSLSVLLQSEEESVRRGVETRGPFGLEQSLISSRGSRYEISVVPLFFGDLCTHLAIYAVNERAKALESPMVSDKGSGIKMGEPLEYESSEIFFRADVAIVATNEEGSIVQANYAASEMFGYPRDELIGLSVHLLVPPNFRRQHERYFLDFIHSAERERSMGRRGEISGYRKDGSFFPAEASLAKYESAHGVVVIATLSDITARKKAQENLIWQATHDPLTQLPNRNLIKERLANALERTRYSEGVVALMFIDIDLFKLINDGYGHEAGDRLLTILAVRLLDTVRPGDTVARFGGDEFLVLCDQITDQQVLPTLAAHILEAVKVSCEVEGMQFYPAVSIGIAIGSGASDSADTLLRKADSAMYEVKQHGGDNWRIFDQGIGDANQLYLKHANGLRQAISKNQLENYYQPIVDMRSHRIIGAEALLRWRFDGTLVPPDKFIPVAEMTGSIVQIGEWVFEQACQQQVRWQQQFGDDAPYMSINLSARQLIKDDIVETLKGIMKKTQANPQKIILEITETTLMSDMEQSRRVMAELGSLGLTFAIDDFGTGHSSLSRIKSLPISLIKVDKVFVREVETDDSSHAIATAVINMAHALDLKVTAEGVEDMGQFGVLHKMGCDNAQGYLFAKPVPESEMLDLLAHYRHGYQLSGVAGSESAL